MSRTDLHLEMVGRAFRNGGVSICKCSWVHLQMLGCAFANGARRTYLELRRKNVRISNHPFENRHFRRRGRRFENFARAACADAETRSAFL